MPCDDAQSMKDGVDDDGALTVRYAHHRHPKIHAKGGYPICPQGVRLSYLAIRQLTPPRRRLTDGKPNRDFVLPQQQDRLFTKTVINAKIVGL